MSWYVSKAGEVIGPMTAIALVKGIESGQFAAGCHVCESKKPWEPIESSKFGEFLAHPSAASITRQAGWEPGPLAIVLMITGGVVGFVSLLWATGFLDVGSKSPRPSVAEPAPPPIESLSQQRENVASARFEELKVIVRKNPFYKVKEAVAAMGQPAFCKVRDSDPDSGICTWLFAESSGEQILVLSSGSAGSPYNSSDGSVLEIVFTRNSKIEERIDGGMKRDLKKLSTSSGQ